MSEHTAGPWNDEPDTEEFEIGTLHCVIHRHPYWGHLCGYVGVRKGHPLYKVDYNQPAPALAEAWKKRKDRPLGNQGVFAVIAGSLSADEAPRPDAVLEVHGGITYAGNGIEGMREGRWYFGFDCAHLGDMSPYHDAFSLADDGVYRDITYVRREIVRLADQLSKLAVTNEEAS